MLNIYSRDYIRELTMNNRNLNPSQGLLSYAVSDVMTGDHSKPTDSASLAHAEREIKVPGHIQC